MSFAKIACLVGAIASIAGCLLVGALADDDMHADTVVGSLFAWIGLIIEITASIAGTVT